MIKGREAIELAAFAGRLNAICDEMGSTLQQSALSPNIKDRLDFSCAIFDRKGELCAQAAHIPVHLGSMAFAMKTIVADQEWAEGDAVVLNDPFAGGTHLPDVTMIAPLFVDGVHLGFVANRAHHANIGSRFPGSMPLSDVLEDEGVLIPPSKLYSGGELQGQTVALLQQIDPTLKDALPGDFLAQLSANRVGIARLQQWLREQRNAPDFFNRMTDNLNRYAGGLMQALLREIPSGEAIFEDYLDDDGFSSGPLLLRVKVTSGECLLIDFSGTASQARGNINCPFSVTVAAVYYVLMALLPSYVPRCAGVFRAVEIRAPEGCLLHALPGAAVAAGNVETSMRIVDVLLGALSQLGLRVPAAAQGTMNNIAMGGRETRHWDYYETLGGGMGAGPEHSGLSGVQCHMTNTLNTPVESLELHYPLRVVRYAIRRNSGGDGAQVGGDGLIREYEFLEPTRLTLLSERRRFRPWGLHGGEAGALGQNQLNGRSIAGKLNTQAHAGDRLCIATPGGGGWGARENEEVC